MLLDESSLDIVEKYRKIQQYFYSLKESKKGLETIYNECYKNENSQIGYLRLFKSQSYGPLMEKLHLRHYADYIKKVPAHKDKGDYKNEHGFHWEYKFSMAGNKGEINFVQLRPWQGVDYVFEVLHLNNELEVYCIPHASLNELIDRYGMNAHGTKKSNQSNDKVEKALRPKCTRNDKCWQEIQKFKISRDKLRDYYKVASARRKIRA